MVYSRSNIDLKAFLDVFSSHFNGISRWMDRQGSRNTLNANLIDFGSKGVGTFEIWSEPSRSGPTISVRWSVCFHYVIIFFLRKSKKISNKREKTKIEADSGKIENFRKIHFEKNFIFFSIFFSIRFSTAPRIHWLQIFSDFAKFYGTLRSRAHKFGAFSLRLEAFFSRKGWERGWHHLIRGVDPFFHCT